MTLDIINIDLNNNEMVCDQIPITLNQENLELTEILRKSPNIGYEWKWKELIIENIYLRKPLFLNELIHSRSFYSLYRFLSSRTFGNDTKGFQHIYDKVDFLNDGTNLISGFKRGKKKCYKSHYKMGHKGRGNVVIINNLKFDNAKYKPL
jgi:hypothetical protein